MKTFLSNFDLRNLPVHWRLWNYLPTYLFDNWITLALIRIQLLFLLQLKERFHDLKEGSKIVSSREFRPMNMQISERNLSGYYLV